jgi:hypothetical protein
MNTRTRWLLLACGAGAVLSVAAFAPTMLRRMDSFRVERVEIRGTRYLAPYEALVQSGITRKSNVFDEFEPWRARLLRHPMVVAADVERELPNTIKVSITEAEPIALARTPALTPVDARARALPIDPSTVDLDLPLLARSARPDANGFFKDRATRDVIAVLNVLRHKDARLYSWISDAAVIGNEGLLLNLREPLGAQALVPADPRALRLRELEVTLSDLSARGELSQMKRIDARFRDQIVVSLDQANRN